MRGSGLDVWRHVRSSTTHAIFSLLERGSIVLWTTQQAVPPILLLQLHLQPTLSQGEEAQSTMPPMTFPGEISRADGQLEVETFGGQLVCAMPVTVHPDDGVVHGRVILTHARGQQQLVEREMQRGRRWLVGGRSAIQRDRATAVAPVPAARPYCECQSRYSRGIRRH